MRTCIEVEANCKAILQENGYADAGKWNIDDYKKIQPTHHLASYEVQLPHWHGTQSTRQPFASWATNAPLQWYQAYNLAKHDRRSNFQRASFTVLIDAVCGLVALLSAQFLSTIFLILRFWLCRVSGLH
jgi:hypothetical protein